MKVLDDGGDFTRIEPLGRLPESAAAGVRQVHGLIYGSIIPWPNDDVESLIGSAAKGLGEG
jgi:hypothetical protein